MNLIVRSPKTVFCIWYYKADVKIDVNCIKEALI